MPVDFTQLPPEEPEFNDPPSQLVWTVVFFLIAFIGVFAVLFFWPQDEPTQTLWFWTCVTVYPFGIATFVILRRYSVYEGRRLDVIAWNAAREKYVNEIFDIASRPLAVLAAACRFSSDAEEDDFSKILDGSVRLEPRTALKPNSPPVNARWFEKPDADANGVRFKHDDERQRYVLEWAFGIVIEAVAEAVHSLPLELPLKIQLLPADLENTDEALAIWKRQWAKADFRTVQTVQTEVLAEPPDLMHVDTWLDQVNQKLGEEARLIVGVRLHAIYQMLPPAGSAEAFVAVLLAPESVARRFKLAPLAMLHRPNGMEACAINDALGRALQWGCVEASEIKRIWQAGLDGPDANAANAAWVKAEIDAKAMDLNYMVGHAGAIAPWLSMAYAVNAADQDKAPQLVATAGKAGACFSVLRNSD